MILDCLLVALVAGASSLATTSPPAHAASDPENDSVVRSYDLDAMSGQYRSARRRVRLFPGSHHREFYDEYDVEELQSMEFDRIYELVYSLLGEEVEYEGRMIWMSNEGKLVLRAPEPVQARVQEILGFVAAAQSSQTHLLVDVIEVPSGPSNAGPVSGVVDLSQARRLLAMAERGGASESYRLLINFAGGGRVSNTSHHSFVGDYDVEVAQDAFALDPTMMTMTSGLELEVSAAPAKGGTRLTIALSHGTPTGPIEEVEMELSGLTNNDNGGVVYDVGAERIERFAVMQRSMALQTVLPTGKALVFHTGAQLATAETTQLVVLRQEGRGLLPVQSSAFQQGPGEVHLVNLRAMAPYHYGLQGQALAGGARMLLARQDTDNYDVDLWAELEQHDTGFYDDLLGNLGDESDLMWDSDDHWFIAYRGEQEDPEAERRDVGSMYAAAADALMPETEVVPLTLEIERSGEDGSRGLKLYLPVLVGARSAVSIGVESTVIRDYNVEIAQGSAIVDPITGVEIDGAALALLPQRTADGRLLLQVRGFVQLLSEDRSFDPKGPALSPVHLPQYDRLLIDETLDLSSGSAVLGNTNVEGRAGSVRLEAGIGQAFQVDVQTR